MIRKIKFLAARFVMGLALVMGLGFGLLAAGVAASLGCLFLFAIWAFASARGETVETVVSDIPVQDADAVQPQAG